MPILLRRYLLILGLSVSALYGEVSAREQLRIVAWEGYADPEVVKTFEQRFNVDVEVTLVATDDELWDKINRNNAADYDVFAVNTAELQRYIDRGLSIPIRLSHIPNRAAQLPRFHQLAGIPGLMHRGEVYGIPYTYSEMGLIYDQKRVKNIPDSISALWDPAYRGRVLAYNGSSHNFSIAGMAIGASSPFRLDKQEYIRATAKLIELRRNVLAFYSSPQEAVKLFTENDVVVVYANYGSQQLKALRDAGAHVGYVIPREGALAWLDCWTVTRGARNRRLAEQWINYTLEKSVSERLPKLHGLASTREAFPAIQPEARFIWLEPVENSAKRKQLWDRILSGDRFVE